MKRTLFLLFTVLALLASAFAVSAQDGSGVSAAKGAEKKVELPAAKALFTKYVEALGGREALEKVKSRVETGTVELLPYGLQGTFEISAKAPDKQLVSISLPQVGDILDGFDGTRGWASNPMEGFRLKAGEELARSKQEEDFYWELNLEKYYPNAEVTGIEKDEAREWYVVKADADTTLYFDSKTGLLIRSDREAVTSQGKIPTKTYIDEYRKVGDLTQPSAVRQILPEAEFRFKIEEEKFNVDIDDSKFAPPGK